MNAELERLRKKVQNYPSPSVFGRLAELLLQDGETDEAERICRSGIKEFPRNGQVYAVLARILASRKDRPGAYQALQQGLGQDPRNLEILRLLADLHAEDGQAAQAIAAIEKALSLRPDDAALGQKLAALKGGGTPGAPPPAAAPAAPPPATRPPSDPDTIDLTTFSSGLTSILRSPVAPAAAPRRSSDSVLAPLAAEPGVLGAMVVDRSGRSVVSAKMSGGRDDLLGALACDVTAACTAALTDLAAKDFHAWAIACSNGQVLAFRRAGAEVILLVLAEPTVKPALVELKARQALIDLGMP